MLGANDGTSIGDVNDDLLGTQELDAESQTIQGFSIPGCPDNYPYDLKQNLPRALCPRARTYPSVALCMCLRHRHSSFPLYSCVLGAILCSTTPSAVYVSNP